jgi:hypothetical protein
MNSLNARPISFLSIVFLPFLMLPFISFFGNIVQEVRDFSPFSFYTYSHTSAKKKHAPPRPPGIYQKG